ncbi:MAG: PqqD family protein [Legionella sp.]|nr:PqqD family protein [Legionella sp.]
MLAINQDVVFTQIDHDIVMMEPSTGEYHGLNTVGAELWNLLDEKPTNIASMVHFLQNNYAIDEATATADVQAFVDALLGKAFLVMTAD